jgi:hypothetical protein
VAELCPICKLSVEDLDRHVWRDHVPGLKCWCGAPLYWSPFAEHCEANGGYLVHYLESQLGVGRG